MSTVREELVSLNLGELDVEELEQRLELQTDAAAPDCDCWSNSCTTYCNRPAPTTAAG